MNNDGGVGRGRTSEGRPDLARAVQQAREGSEQAFEVVFHELAGPVAGYLRMNGMAEADELTNEVFAQVHRGLPGFEGDAVGFRSWVFTIAHHRMVDQTRRARRRPPMALGDVAEEMSTGDVEDEAIDELARDRTLELLASISDDQRQVLLLRIVGDLSLHEVAVALGKSVGAVKSLQHRGLAALRRLLEHEDAGHGA
jgi:RNA polymerase sigma-70 factor (ECF subfamily)